ncbi:MAG TPA: hypothetical protein VJT49_09465 [Amycolatopsis sp.]|uniref:hypothetical protein n=1 Tax=Amycolatopsis sp. TaxID=37632 RepID=UPI002B477AC9|nr:hypothetical protein [Amycolatopsis sp.]HKS45326.1 hypothetical protein [Amycolatopsis sp.]
MAKDDDARFDDGTQAPAFRDPLSGQASDASEDFKLTRVASPVKPDPGVVRDLVEAELASDRLGRTAAYAPVTDDSAPPAAPAEPIPPAAPLGMLPRQRRTRPALRRPAFRIPRISMPDPTTVRRVKPSSGSTGIIIAVLLVIVFVVLAIEFVASLVTGITGLFS